MAAGYLAGLIDPSAFIRRLSEERLTGPASYMAEAFSIGVLMMAARENAAPEPPAPVSGALRPEPSELVRVTATARQLRGAA